MLEQLLTYAQKLNAVEPGFKPKTARWAVNCTADGRYIGIIPLGDTELGRKNPGETFPKAPDLSQGELVGGGGNEKRCHFLIEEARVVALHWKGDEDDVEREKARKKHESFIRLLRNVSPATLGLTACADVLTDEDMLRQIRADFEARTPKVSATDKVTIALETELPVRSDDWHEWWRAYRESIAGGADTDSEAGQKCSAIGSDTGEMRCFATGKLIVPAKTHPKISGLSQVGGLAMGDVLIGFDKDATRSYGLEQSANAAVSGEAAAQYRAALDDLIVHHSNNLAGAKVVHWYSRHVEAEDDPLSFLTEGDQSQERNAQRAAAELLQAIREGKRPQLTDAMFYAITLSGASGRVMVRDWMEGSFEDLVVAVNRWFDDLAIVSAFDGGTARLPSIEHVITCQLRPKGREQQYKDWVKPLGGERVRLWHAALDPCSRIPQSVLARVVNKLRPLLATEAVRDMETQTKSLLCTRMGLLKAYHIRKGDKALNPYLNEDHPSPAYHCGRLMAVLADLQYAAQGNVNATVVQRYYAAASSTPALVLGRLLRLASTAHLPKLEGGLAYWYQQRLAAIQQRSRMGDVFPRTLSLEEQSLFALGYYQQLAAPKGKGVTDTTTQEANTHE